MINDTDLNLFLWGMIIASLLWVIAGTIWSYFRFSEPSAQRPFDWERD